MKNTPKNEHVTQTEFRTFTTGPFKDLVVRVDKLTGRVDHLTGRVDHLTDRVDHLTVRVDVLDKKVDRVIVSLLKTQDDVAEIKQNMATKQDINRILDRIDFLTGKNKVVDQEQSVQALHIKELRDTSQNHEIRISSLESSNPS